MFTLRKKFSFDAAHHLQGVMPTGHKCTKVHGHTWNGEIIINYYSKLPERGYIIDFGLLGGIVKKFDHENINMLLDKTTAERISEDILYKVVGIIMSDTQVKLEDFSLQVVIAETPDNVASCSEDFRPRKKRVMEWLRDVLK